MASAVCKQGIVATGTSEQGSGRYRIVTALVLAFGLLAAACGGDDDNGGAGTTEPEAPAEATDPEPEEEEQDEATTGADADEDSSAGASDAADGTDDEADGSDADEDGDQGGTDDADSVAVATQPIVDRTLTVTDDAETSQAATDSGEAAIAVFDRFELDEDATVGTVRWEGFYCRLVDGGPTPDPTASAFVITIVGGDENGPDVDDTIAETTIASEDATETFRAAADRPCGAVATSVAFYGYEAVLDEGPALSPDRSYWLSIQAVTPDFSTYWAWRGSTGDDSTSTRRFGGESLDVFGDRAFALTPEG